MLKAEVYLLAFWIGGSVAVIGYGLSCYKGIRGSVIGYTIHIIVTGNCEIQGGGIRYRIRIGYGSGSYRDGIDRGRGISGRGYRSGIRDWIARVDYGLLGA